MATIIEGNLSAKPYAFGVVVSRFNEFITKRLLDAALDCLQRHGAIDDSITVARCPGAFEIPHVANQMARTGKYDAIICLGCLIRGETPHFDYIAQAAAHGVAKAVVDTGVPMAFGILTTETLEQAIDRAGAKSGNKGWDAALAAIELADLQKKISRTRKK